MFCRELVADLRAAVAADPTLPEVVLFALANQASADAFFAERWPSVAVVCEPTGRFHRDLLGARRMRMWELLRPSLWRRMLQARREGHAQGTPEGDVWRLGGAMLVQGERIVWHYQAATAADHPDLSAVPRDIGD